MPDIAFLNAGTNNPNSNNIASFKEAKKIFETIFWYSSLCRFVNSLFRKQK